MYAFDFFSNVYSRDVIIATIFFLNCIRLGYLVCENTFPVCNSGIWKYKIQNPKLKHTQYVTGFLEFSRKLFCKITQIMPLWSFRCTFLIYMKNTPFCFDYKTSWKIHLITLIVLQNTQRRSRRLHDPGQTCSCYVYLPQKSSFQVTYNSP